MAASTGPSSGVYPDPFGRSRKAEVLRPRDASVPVRRAAHGPRPQLFDRRCAGSGTSGCRAFASSIPMGWDSFGLPAENAAIKNRRRSARVDTRRTSTAMRRQLDSAFGFSYDWDCEMSSCEPEYYRWNQWFFLQDVGEGAWPISKKASVNWCPACATVLANEPGSWAAAAGVTRRLPSRAAGTRAVVLPDHCLLRTSFWKPLDELKSRLARPRPDHATPLDRSLRPARRSISRWRAPTRRFACLHHPRRHDLRGHLCDPGTAASAGCRVRIRRTKASGWQRPPRRKSPDDLEKEGFFIGTLRDQPLQRRAKLPIWVGQLRGHDLRHRAQSWPVPAHDQRDFEFCRKHGIRDRCR